ncbi:60S ribosomal protein L23A (nucleomorph) [Chroomonas mesostigmatica CCMP1168]|uniref:60S ribosomal protein L23A n=1 Tax=Chroomonas mesostigmatica CCMP1168 TaxID=1195612 RepID=J7GAV2_9CRYP|nr:60S ribosomal protein L23A [Chroomonas mesostigmatica CCMP1168]
MISKSTPKYSPKLLKSEKKKKNFSILKYPLTTETAIKKIQYTNTLFFIVENFSKKKQIKNSIKKFYKVNIKKVNTLIQLNGKKRAFVKLSPDCDALELANKIGFI